MSDLDSAPESEGSRFGKAHHILLIFTAAALVIWLLTGIYKVNADEVAIVERLGQYLATPEGKPLQLEQGLHYALPWPIDKVHKVSVQQTFTLRVNAFDAAPAENAELKTQLLMQRYSPETISAIFDPYLITADKSIVHMDVSIVYRINDPVAYLNTISHTAAALDGKKLEDYRDEMFQQIVQHTIVSAIAHMPMQNVLFTDLQSLPASLMASLEQEMTFPEPSAPGGRRTMGIQLQKVEVVKARPPEFVKRAFDDVVQSQLQMDTRKKGGDADKQAAITKANGDKTTLVVEAEGYKKQAVESARGEANRFRELLVQYENAPDVTRWNVFVDAVSSVSKNAKRIVFAQSGQKITLTVDPPEFDAGQAAPNK